MEESESQIIITRGWGGNDSCIRARGEKLRGINTYK